MCERCALCTQSASTAKLKSQATSLFQLRLCPFVQHGQHLHTKRDRDEDQTSDVNQQPVGGARKRQKRVQSEVGGSSGGSQPSSGNTLSGARKRDRELARAAHGLEDDESNYEPEDRTFKRLRWRGTEADRRNEEEAQNSCYPVIVYWSYVTLNVCAVL
jgi:hypothetical protein